MCHIKNHDNMAQKLKEMTDTHKNKTDLQKNI